MRTPGEDKQQTPDREKSDGPVCDVCKDVLPSRRALSAHVREHDNEEVDDGDPR